MFRPVLQFAAVGVVGFLAWKLFSLILLPLVGTLLGLVFFFLKIALVVALAYFVFRLLRKRDDKPDSSEAPAS